MGWIGYPLGLKAEDIDLNARIFAVADAFDAMTSDRVYRRGKSYEAASQELDDWPADSLTRKWSKHFTACPKMIGTNFIACRCCPEMKSIR